MNLKSSAIYRIICCILFATLLAGCKTNKPHDVDFIKNSWRTLTEDHVQIIQYGDTLRLILPIDYFFQLNSPKFEEDQLPTLKRVARFVKSYGDVPILITGHTDNIGSEKTQKRFSKALADNVAAFFWAEGINHRNIKTIGYGNRKTIATDKTPYGSAYNRRVEIHINFAYPHEDNLLN